MKKYLLLLCVSLLSFAFGNAQNWSITLSQADKLPGEKRDYYGNEFYYYISPQLTPGGKFNRIRITVTETSNNQKPNGNNVIFSLSELYVYDENGSYVPYTANSNADHNELTGSTDGGGIDALNDDNVESYFHSMWHGEWQGSTPVTEYHYIELELERTISSFHLEWSTRLEYTGDAPTTVGITLGEDYSPEVINTDFSLGNRVTTEEGLNIQKNFFVLRSNSQYSFTTNDGYTHSGSGPVYMQSAESGDVKATQEHIVQFIPYDDGRYIIYWPFAKKFLKDSSPDYNGKNGWQYSTYLFEEAAKIKFTPNGYGYFEMEYEGTYENQPLTYYIGADLRDGVSSKMKTFDLDHKQYLEEGDYTQGFSMPIAFNWSIYKANISDEDADKISLNFKNIASTYISSTIEEAENYLATNGNFNGLCQNGEDSMLQQEIDDSHALLEATSISFADIYQQKAELLNAMSQYLAVKIGYYTTMLDELLARVEFSEQPNYIKDTYPESSRSILDGLQATIENTKNSIATLSAKQLNDIYRKIEQDFELFESTKITESTTPKEDNEDTTTIDAVFVYLPNGDVDAFALSEIDGEHYTDKGILYIPLKDGDVYRYNKEEYDRCSTTPPALPTMTSFKFNNKYNPTLFVDAIAATVTQNMNFDLNAIGKWLTASFTLSDSNAVAYIDTIQQISKKSRQSFKDGATYTVTYPGYNIIKSVKIQDEIWGAPTVNSVISEVNLTADMLSTNKPSTSQNESLANLLDGGSGSIFHSTWGSANNATLNVNTYITIDLPEALEKMQIYYKCRPGNGYNPLVWEIYASNDGDDWQLVRTLDYIQDNMPTGGTGQEYTSPTINLLGSYSKIKILQTRGEYSKNHLVLSELRINKVIEKSTGEPEKIQDAIYETKRVPFGNEYKVNINWLTDAQNSVPRIDIDIDNGLFVTSKDYYLNANLRIFGYGIYDSFEDSVQIKGRGNSSWGASKKPYRLKFDEKVKPFGLTKGKSWVLLANAQKRSLMANAISMKIGQMAGAQYTNHIVPVELYMNGEYMGSYMFTEKVGLANNSVDVDEDTGYMLELDKNDDDEFKFLDNYYNLPIYIKEPDFSDYSYEVGEKRKSNIIAQMNELCRNLKNGNDITSMFDMDAFARFMLANDLSLNQEIGHPKSVFLFKENENSNNSKFKFGPIWDFDWGYGYETAGTYCEYGATSSVLNDRMSGYAGYNFFSDLLSLESFKKHYYKVWLEFIENNSIDELIDYIDSYYTFAESSFLNNINIWRYGFSEDDKERHKSWIKERMNYIYENLDKYNIDDLIYTVVGDVNCNNRVTIHDAALVTAYLKGYTHPSLSEAKADCNKNGKIEIEDARTIAKIIKGGNSPALTYWKSTPQAVGEFYSPNVMLEIGNIHELKLNMLSYEQEQYKALQFDIIAPADITLTGITNGEAIENHNFSYINRGNNTYRVLAYSDEDMCFSTGDDNIINIELYTTDIINEENRNIKIANIYVVDNENNELRFNDYNITFSQVSGISNVTDALIEGGECITITLLKAQRIDIYSVDGRRVRSIDAKEGTTRVSMPAGVYIVNDEKVVVK